MLESAGVSVAQTALRIRTDMISRHQDVDVFKVGVLSTCLHAERSKAPSLLRRRNSSGALSQIVTPHADIVNLDSRAVSRIITHRGASGLRAAAVTEIAAGSRLPLGGSKVEWRGPCADPDAFHRLKA
jgi:hypothetical protein